MPHSPAFINLQRRKLTRLRDEITQSSVIDRAGVDRTQGTDAGDLGSQDAALDLSFSLVERSRETLRDVEDALRRISNGTYGLCERTYELIPEARLEALPFARCTVAVQRGAERYGKKARQYGVKFEDDVVLEKVEE